MADASAQRLAPSAETRSICDGLLQRSLEVTGATLGNIQLVDWRTGELKIVSQLGFQLDFLRFFERVKYRDSCACARALGTRAPVVVGDVMLDAAFAPYRDIAHRAGFRAVQSTPLLSSSSALVGILSTHFPTAHTPTVLELASLKEIGRFAANAIIAHRARSRPASRVSPAVRREIEKAEEYRQYAAECQGRAVNSEDIAVRRQLLELAQQWCELADQTDQESELNAPTLMEQ
ncbi:MAG TPA: GAF domain-containing protein [Xanthobacteraceae bacterium]